METVEYVFTHETDTTKNSEGGNTGYFYNLLGTTRETGEHECVGSRNKGEVGSCTVTDSTDIGVLTGVRIRNSGNNAWTFVKMEVRIEGVLWGSWQGTHKVADKSTSDIEFTRSGELVVYGLFV